MPVLRRGDLGRLAGLFLALFALAAGSGAGAAVDLVLTANKATFARTEPIMLTIAVVNRDPGPVTLQFRTAQRYDVVVRDAANAEVWRWSDGQMFAQILGEETLAGQGMLRHRVTVRHRLPAGRYTVVATVPAQAVELEASLHLTVR